MNTTTYKLQLWNGTRTETPESIISQHLDDYFFHKESIQTDFEREGWLASSEELIKLRKNNDVIYLKEAIEKSRKKTYFVSDNKDALASIRNDWGILGRIKRVEN